MPIRLDGPTTSGTIGYLVEGVRAAPLPMAAVDATLAQAAAFVEQLVDVYESDVAPGEVGVGGTGRASHDSAKEGEPTALLYGRVQSGKTVGMILTTALCIDNGFRSIVVLTSNNVALVRQTAARFKALDGPRVFSSVEDDTAEWEGQEDTLLEELETDGIVLVCAKDAFHLPKIIRFLQRIGAPDFPSLVLDDEADAATPDTTAAVRAAGKPNAPPYGSTINRLVIKNDHPDQLGESVLEMLTHRLYVQVTATPYVLFLQGRRATLRPKATFLLEAGEGYCGGAEFFEAFEASSTDVAPPLVIVSPTEAKEIVGRSVPSGLAASIAFFVMSACARGHDGGWPAEGFKHLSHTSPAQADHTLVAGHIERQRNLLRRTLRRGGQGARDAFQTAYDELAKTVNGLPGIDALIDIAASAIKQTEICRVNSATDAPIYGPRLNFVIGGNILGRGLTLDDLLVTYYIREAQVSQMDTVWQHARMFGYRRSYFGYIRVYMPKRLARRFQEIHLSEVELRTALRNDPSGLPVFLRIPKGTRATRTNAIGDVSHVTVAAGREQVNPHRVTYDIVAVAEVNDLLAKHGVPLHEAQRSNRAIAIPFEAALQLIRAAGSFADDPGLWSSDVAAAIMGPFEDACGGELRIYVRQLEDTDGTRTRARLSGPEVAEVRRAAGALPTLVMLYVRDGGRVTGWFPTLVMPPGSPTYVINPE